MLLVAVLIALAWPGVQHRKAICNDGMAYVDWPKTWYNVLAGGWLTVPKENPLWYKVMGARPPVFPLFLRALSVERPNATMARAQTVVSVIVWSVLGWAVAGYAGLICGGLFASAPWLWIWNLILLSESTAFSAYALAVAAAIFLAKKFTVPRYLAWVAAIWALGGVRDTALYIVPFLLFPVFWQNWRRAALMVAAAAVVYLVHSHSAQVNERWRWPFTNVVLWRILPDPQASADLQAVGMPLNAKILQFSGRRGGGGKYIFEMRAQAPELDHWIEDHGFRAIQRWIITNPKSYTATVDQLKYVLPFKLDLMHSFGEGFTPPWISRWTDWLWRPIVPFAFWCAILLLPIADYLVVRRWRVLPVAAAALTLGTYAQAFISYTGDADEVVRHMMLSSVMYRSVQLIAVACVLSMFWQIVIRIRAAVISRSRPEPATGIEG